jgi:hypothetical protein
MQIISFRRVHMLLQLVAQKDAERHITLVALGLDHWHYPCTLYYWGQHYRVESLSEQPKSRTHRIWRFGQRAFVGNHRPYAD